MSPSPLRPGSEGNPPENGVVNCTSGLRSAVGEVRLSSIVVIVCGEKVGDAR